MGCGKRMLWTAALVAGATASAVRAGDSSFGKPVALSLQPDEPESVYAPPSPPREDSGVNEGAVHFELAIRYSTDYVFRGIERFEPTGAEDRASAQIDAKLSWDLGKLPHPFIGLFVNYAESDPISTFQEVRPVPGFDWTIRPVKFSGGFATYLFPDRDDSETSEVWGRIEIDDSYFLHTDGPLFSPYVFAAYDVDLYNGWYFEAGVEHDFVVEDTGLTLTAEAHIAYVKDIELFDATGGVEEPNGLQHYQFGLTGTYSLNKLLNFPTRYGEWSLQGFIFYTDGIDDDLLADTQLWGGAGILFKY